MSEHTGSYGELVDTTMRVVTWNLWWRFGPWETRHPAIESTLRALDPDVVALQEVWDDGERNQAALLGDALGLHHVYSANRDMDGVRFGNAVLSRWPITGHDWRALPAPPEHDEQRNVLRADIDGPRGPLQLFSTHLNWRYDHSHVRQDQVRAISEFVRSAPKRSFPPIVCGDFNAVADSDEIRMMTGRTTTPVEGLVFYDAWEVAGDRRDPDAGITWSNENPWAGTEIEVDRRIDYVFVGWPRMGGLGHVTSCSVEGRDPIDGVVPSDHHAVRADLRY